MNLLRLCLLGFIAFPGNVLAANLQNAQLWTGARETRVVLTLDGPVIPQVQTLAKPARLVLDLPNCTVLQGVLPRTPLDHPVITGLRTGKQGQGARLVFDLKQASRLKTYTLPQGKGTKLVLELAHPALSPPLERLASAPLPVAKQSAKATPPLAAKVKPAPAPLRRVNAPSSGRNVVVAIDAGHGGVDPGAIGPSGTQEKQVTLAVARRLAALLNTQAGIQAVLTRDGDYFLPLQRRMQLARAKKADLFVSIHADSAPNGAARGASIYALSQRGASSTAAKWLADRENAADLRGGVSLDNKDAVVSKVLLDLSQTGSRLASQRVAATLLAKLDAVGAVHKPEVQYAGFAVLKAPDVPSVLVETAFLSHPEEERLLASPAHQAKLARALMQGIVRYFNQAPPPGTYLAQQHSLPVQASIVPGTSSH